MVMAWFGESVVAGEVVDIATVEMGAVEHGLDVEDGEAGLALLEDGAEPDADGDGGCLLAGHADLEGCMAGFYEVLCGARFC